MIFRLDKMSGSGWDKPKEFETKEELRQELLLHICGLCTEDFGSWTPTVEDLMGTACGCEYDYEEVDDANDY